MMNLNSITSDTTRINKAIPRVITLNRSEFDLEDLRKYNGKTVYMEMKDNTEKNKVKFIMNILADDKLELTEVLGDIDLKEENKY